MFLTAMENIHNNHYFNMDLNQLKIDFMKLLCCLVRISWLIIYISNILILNLPIGQHWNRIWH